MRIKKLTIHGFKSFVDKSTLDFSKGTSGIIGPNGCGKSNIVDAIRWVIGEQNARHLRGKSMEDIIFNGSESRKPLGMAEVFLTFSNEDGNAPARYAGFTEIEIGRRLYRSGESEYFINKVQARLRDIIDLFTDTGIGSKAYSIVEQGQVGWLVNAKPEERRVIFEEAAGINKFKHKKQAAIRRLDSTKENLTRVNDIISEVKRQLNSLNRQAKKAERYKVMRDELKDVELTLYSHELGRIKQVMAETSRRLEELRDEEMALANTIATREGLAEELRAEYLSAESEFKNVRERVYVLERAIQEKERSSALVEMRVEELKRDEERLTVEIEDLRERKSGEERLISELNSAMEDLTNRIEAESKRLEEATARLDALSEDLRAREEVLRSGKAESLGVSTRLSDIRHSIQTILRDEESLRAKEARARAEIEEIKVARAECDGPIAELREMTDGAGHRKAAIEDGIASARETLTELEAKRGVLEAELSTSRDSHSKLSSRLAAIEEVERKHENLQGGARAIMQKEDRHGIHGILADCFETSPGYEKAVEAVLGERLQYVIVESHREGVEAIEYLTRRAAGRGSFVPVQNLRATGAPVPANSADYVPSGASELAGELRVRDGFESILHHLVGDVLVVDDLAAALDIWRQNGVYRTIVTRAGEIVDPQGIITGGSGEGSGGDILQKRAEMKALKEEVASLDEKLAALRGELERTVEEIRSSKALLEEKKEALHAVELEAINAESELKRRTAEAARLAERQGVLEGDIAESNERLAEAGRKKDELAREREGLEEELRVLDEKSGEVEREIAGLSEKKDELAGSVTEVKVALAQATERFESLRKECDARSGSIGDIERRVESKAAEIKRGAEEAKAKEDELEGLKAAIEEKLAEAEGVRSEEVSMREGLDEIEEKIKSVEKELKAVKDRSSELLELKGELSIEVREMDLKMGNLREKATEKYNLDLDAYTPPALLEEEIEGADATDADSPDNNARVAAEGPAEPDVRALDARRRELQEKLNGLGPVNLSALEEYAEHEERHNFLLGQQADLNESVESLMKAITRINRTTRERFRASFDAINEKFQESFPKFFRGGKAELRLTEGDDILEAGVDIVVQPPGKRLQNITLLSGGEKALTATSLIFSIFLTKPSPFCLLDEVDAPLDDANIDRFNTFVKEMSEISQFLLITHNKKTMEIADTLYGVTMEEPGVSKIITLDL